MSCAFRTYFAHSLTWWWYQALPLSGLGGSNILRPSDRLEGSTFLSHDFQVSQLSPRDIGVSPVIFVSTNAVGWRWIKDPYWDPREREIQGKEIILEGQAPKTEYLH
ncbi:hypothetical protein RRG08_040625 [Elysia crispata]|uniref:Uncharacterized protein n=1 Tax=Elysia crispata TaxID=231223 RepID=A0AAE1E906_9GAST|nr:hypothetical protein RRG08_040625 [Elysia crispata]